MKIRVYLLTTQGMTPQAGLTLADFKVNVWSINKSSAAKSHVVTDAALSFEVGNGMYGYHYSTSVDFKTYDYVVCVTYSGSTVLDNIAWSNFGGGSDLVDVLRVDTVSEISQGAPPALPTLEEILNYVYRQLRNKREVTASEDAVYDDAGTAKLFKSSLADNGTIFTKSEAVSGA